MTLCLMVGREPDLFVIERDELPADGVLDPPSSLRSIRSGKAADALLIPSDKDRSSSSESDIIYG